MAVLGDKNIKELTGVVLGNKMSKTVVVSVERVKLHPLYQKRYVVSKKYYAHDDLGLSIGDKVKIRATKPISKLKRWIVVEKLVQH
jgi:small subunit ribosomal protein S17